MSHAFRFIRKYAKVFLWIIAILIIPSFILWGVGSAIRTQDRQRFAGRMFQRQVPWNEFNQAYKTTVMLLFLSGLESYLPFLDPVELTWERLILLREAKQQRVRISDREVVDYIQKIPAFQDNGKFDQSRYDQALKFRFQTSPRLFEEEVRKTLAISRLRDQVMGEVRFDEEVLWKEYRAQQDQRRVALIEFKTGDFEKEVSPTEEEMKVYFEARPDTFERPEAIRLQVAGLAVDENNRKEVQRRLDEASDALAASDNTAEPNAFERIAKEKGLILETTEFFSLSDPPPDLPNEVLIEATRLEPGFASETPIETSSGIYVVKLLEKREKRLPSFEEVRTEVEGAFKREKAESLCQEKTRAVLQEIQGRMGTEAISFEEAAKALGLSIQESPPFKQGDPIEGIGTAPELNRAAFALSLKEVGGVIRTQKGFAILQPKEEIPASRESFEKEKGTFREGITQQKRLQHYNEWFLVLKAKADLTSNVEASPSRRSP